MWSSIKSVLIQKWDGWLFLAALVCFLSITANVFWPKPVQELLLRPLPKADQAFYALAAAELNTSQENDSSGLVSASAQETPVQPSRSNRRKYPPKRPKPTLKPHSLKLNQATAEQLDLLPGVGPKLAQRIIDYRKTSGGFQSVEELLSVSGIGPKNFEKMKDYLTL